MQLAEPPLPERIQPYALSNPIERTPVLFVDALTKPSDGVTGEPAISVSVTVKMQLEEMGGKAKAMGLSHVIVVLLVRPLTVIPNPVEELGLRDASPA